MKHTDKSKKILLITYHFPPSPAVGGLRIEKFAKYLPKYNWNPYVLTVKENTCENMDFERLDEIKHLAIYKIRPLPTLDGMYLAVKEAFQKITNKGTDDTKEAPNQEGPEGKKFHPKEKMGKKLKRYILSFLSVPDSKRSWIFPAFIRAVLVIRREKISCILTSGPPYSVHLVGLLAKRATGVRWVADFRDPWMTGGAKRLYYTCDLSLKLDRWLERNVIKGADTVLTTTDRLCEKLKAEHKNKSPNKYICITNGFDSEYFSRFRHLGKYEKFTLTHAGSLYLERTPEPIFQALSELALEGEIRLQGINVKLIGNCRDVNGIPVSKLVSSYGLDGVVEMPGFLSYSKTIEIIRQSHLALLFAPDQPLQIPAKVFDYLGTETKILAISKDGATADLVRSTGIGSAFHPSDIGGIKRYIHEAFINRESILKDASTQLLMRYERKNLTGLLASRLNAICPL